MNSILEKDALDQISLEELDRVPVAKSTELLNTLQSNTEWKDTEKNLMYNGIRMCK
jgi:hypothetical protein